MLGPGFDPCRPSCTRVDEPGRRQSSQSGRIFLAACLWHEKNARAPIPLPFWSAPAQRHHRLELQFGLAWMAEFLECVAAAAITGLQELNRLQEAEKKGRMLGSTARSRLPQAVDAVLRAHIVTAAGLAERFASRRRRHWPFAAIDGEWSSSGGNRPRILAGLRFDLKDCGLPQTHIIFLYICTNPQIN